MVDILQHGCKRWNCIKHFNLDEKKTKMSYWIQVLLTKEYLNSDLVMGLLLKDHMWQILFKQLGSSFRVQKWNYIN